MFKNSYINALLAAVPLLVALVFNPWGNNAYELPKVSFLAVYIGVLFLAMAVMWLKKRELNVNVNKGVTTMATLWVLSLGISSAVFSRTKQNKLLPKVEPTKIGPKDLVVPTMKSSDQKIPMT